MWRGRTAQQKPPVLQVLPGAFSTKSAPATPPPRHPVRGPFRFGGRPALTTLVLVVAALSGGVDDTSLTDHVNACSDCAAEWKQVLESIERTRDIEARPAPLPAEVSRTLRRSSRGAGGKLIDVVERFARGAPADRPPSEAKTKERLPAAAQPEDLTDTSEESSSRKDGGDEADDTD